MTLTIDDFLIAIKAWQGTEHIQQYLDKMTKAGISSRLWRADILEEGPDAFARVGVASGCTDVFDGTGTAAVVDLISTDAKDTAAGVGARTVAVFGIDSAGDYAVEIVDMAGAVASSTTTEWIRLIEIQVNTVGSEKDAAGTITCHENGGAVSTYLTIAIGDYKSHNSQFWVATGWNARPILIDSEYGVEPAAASVDIDAGTTSYFECETGGLTLSCKGSLQYTTLPLSSAVHVLPRGVAVGSDGNTYLSLQHASINTGANANGCYTLIYMLWET